MKVGTVVELKRPCLSNRVGTKGVVFNQYDTGSQIIFENGEYDGFSAIPEAVFFNQSEQEYILQKIGFDPVVAEYQFKNVMQVSYDFAKGFFNHIFK
jgi:hypothetical protein